MHAPCRKRRPLSALLGLAAAMLFAWPMHAAAQVPVSPPAIVSPAASALVAPAFVVTGRVAPGVSALRVSGVVTSTVLLQPPDSDGATFTATVSVRYGRSVVSIAASDGSTWSASAKRTVWRLGATPKVSRFVLVDKSDFMLYVARSGRIVASYPVAIGMHGTPTPTGTRYLGRPISAPSAVWGPFRMRLYRQVKARVSYDVRVDGHRVSRWRTVLRRVGTSYYIHGTNRPSSIGTPASGGCVRLYNKSLRAFAKLTYKGQLTVIRR